MRTRPVAQVRRLHPSWRRAAAAALGAAIALLACASTPQDRAPEVSEAERERFVRRRLEDSRALVAQGRTEHAEGQLRRGLAILPDDASLLRALAAVLEDTGRPREAAEHRERANAIDPIAALPDQPLDIDSTAVLIALVPSDDAEARPGAIDPEFLRSQAADTLRDRMRVRLPGAMFVQTDLASTADAHRWLARYAPRAVVSLRVDRSFCGESIKDGSFAVGWLRVAAQAPGHAVAAPMTVRAVVSEPAPDIGCERQAMERAFEAVLQQAAVQQALARPRAGPDTTPASAVRYARTPWSHESIRALFPRIGSRITKHIEAGRVQLASGEIGSAAADFRRAVHVDPEDPYARAYLNEAETALAMIRELAARDSARRGRPPTDFEPDSVDPRMSPAQVAAIEARLAEERRRRVELLAALAVLDEDLELPSERLIATFRPIEIRDPSSFGPTQAARRAGRDIEARAAYAPSGSVLARYYYAVGGKLPLVREEDTDGDERPDRWIAYAGKHRAEIWEDGSGRGTPDRHFVFAAGGTPLVRIEIDADMDSRPERIFYYQQGLLEREDRDTDGDGAMDRFDRYGAHGEMIERAEDLNSDGEIDIRDSYRAGKLKRREIIDPDVAIDAARSVTPQSRTPM